MEQLRAIWPVTEVKTNNQGVMGRILVTGVMAKGVRDGVEGEPRDLAVALAQVRVMGQVGMRVLGLEELQGGDILSPLLENDLR